VKQLSIVIILILPLFLAGQILDKTVWLPKFDNELPTRFFTITTEGLFQYNINSTSDIAEIGSGTAEISWNRNVTLDLNFPIYVGKNMLLSGGLKYTDEQFYFEDHEPPGYPLYESLDDRNLKRLGGSLNGIFHLKNNRSFIFRSTFYLAGDFYRSDKYFSTERILKSSLALGYGIKKDKNTFHAIGIYAGYTFGRPSIYPAYIFSKRFNNGFAFEAALPQSIKIWKKQSDKFYIHANAKVTGSSYTVRLQHPAFEENGSLQLRHSSLLASVGITHKLSKWIWVEGEIGYSHNINFNVSESNFIKDGFFPRPNKNYMIESDVSGAPFAMISLFLSPPQSFIDKMLNK